MALSRGVRADGEVEWVQVVGESQLPEAGGRIERVFLRPEETRAYPEAIRAILQADLIVAGPGSFYTSILPNLLVKGIKEAICASQAPALYICNVATQPGKTDDYSVSDHMRHLRRHAGDAFLHVLANTTFEPPVLPSSVSHWVAAPAPGNARLPSLHRRSDRPPAPVATRSGEAGEASDGGV